MKADRRAAAVDVRFVLPSANTDGSRPANVERVDVYALSGSAPASENEVLKAGTRIGSVSVKAPRDPDETIEPDEPESNLDPLEGPGLDQGAAAQVQEVLTSALTAGGATRRTYVSVGITTRGRRGPVSQAVAVPLGSAPAAPAQPSVAYDETTVTVSWTPVAGQSGEAENEAVAYHVYDVSPAPPAAEGAPPAASSSPPETRLTQTAVAETTFTDKRIAWNVERCYTVRAVRRVDDLGVEGDAAPSRCTVLRDTFPPAAPSGVIAVASEGAINLIWTPNSERDLAGYRVLRAAAPSAELEPITPGPIAETTFSDKVEAGVRYTYAVQAVDAAGNASALSERVEETAR
jgi:hypothetical protein